MHGHVLVNGRKVDRPSFAVRTSDVITLREGIQKLARDNMESMAGHIVPAWLEVNPAELKTQAVTLPSIDQTPFDVNTNLIVEFYR